MQLAKKNAVALPYKSVDDVKAAYDFPDLQGFLDLYYLGASALKTEDDFYQLMIAYLRKCKEQNIVHCEIMIEPQTYLPAGIGFDVFMPGFKKAIAEADEGWGQSVALILSLLKHETEDHCIEVLKMADAYRQDFVALGMASTEIGNPPEKFERLYKIAKEKGYELTTHAGEEGPAEIVEQSLAKLGVTRIDHGVRSSDDPDLLKDLKDKQIPLTVCPVSNVKLNVFDSMEKHNIVDLLEQGIMVTVNSDDPAYFGAYINENFYALLDAFSLTKAQVVQLLKNAFSASYLPDTTKEKYFSELDAQLA